MDGQPEDAPQSTADLTAFVRAPPPATIPPPPPPVRVRSLLRETTSPLARAALTALPPPLVAPRRRCKTS